MDIDDGAVTGSRGGSSEERDDRDAITAVLVRYARAVDTRDWTLFRSCFTNDVVADYSDIGSWVGIDALTKFMVEGHLGMGPTLHRLTNFEIEIEGERAHALTYVHAVTVLASHADDWFDTVGSYEDQLIREADDWRIASRTFRMVRMIMSPSMSPTPSDKD